MATSEGKNHRALDDAALLRLVVESEDDALGELYDRYSGMLRALARRILGDGGEAEDVLQEGFLQIWRQAPRYDPSRSSVSTWMSLIVRSRAIDRLRTRRVVERTAQSAQQEESVRHTSPRGERNVLDQERAGRLREELGKLPAEQRQVLELAFYGGQTQSEIAAQTGIPLGTVKTRTLLAMKKLRKALRDEIRELL
ncbi:MAG TPA: sigma-70 family RNA polymerase sigma factor [Thermoanaerobaculia bacterium]|nr:sigma-70 family RNA polymerase sigma factor [Thermoanaerobaculia bacterium]